MLPQTDSPLRPSPVHQPLRSRRDKLHLYAWLQCVAWGVYGIVNAAGATLALHVSWWRSIREMAVFVAIGLLLSHAMRLLIRRYGWRNMPLSARLPRILLASLLLGVIAGLVTSSLGLAAWQSADVVVGTERLRPVMPLVMQSVNWATLFASWSALYFIALAIRARQSAELRETELRAALQAAELRLLKSQLNPHFLFNALNTVRALIADEPAQAQKAVTQLARTLRYTLGAGQEDLVTLEQELAIVEDYLGFESLRLGARLGVDRQIAAPALTHRIPVMLLQTLVENAIKHGIAELPAGGVLRIYAALQPDAFVLEVENPSPAHRRPAAHEGIGISNARTRLQLLFGSRATLDLDLSRPGHALARVRVPLAP